jgi:hypothetical protein
VASNVDHHERSRGDDHEPEASTEYKEMLIAAPRDTCSRKRTPSAVFTTLASPNFSSLADSRVIAPELETPEEAFG